MHFHWDLEKLLDLEHSDRRRWVIEIQRMLNP
jgi:flagellar biosynthesis chaperone FliJ